MGHTAKQLSESLFDITAHGAALTREEVLPAWSAVDRLGVVVDRPLGAIGASLLMQLAITAYYDAVPGRREVQLYPEVYLFHVGGNFGSHAYYDIYPARKEVVVSDDPAEVLEAVNDRAITRLVVVDGPAEAVVHHYKEPAIALDRVVDALVYHPSGRVSRPDFHIRATSRKAVVNTKMTLEPDREYAEQVEARVGRDGIVAEDDSVILPENERFPATAADYLRNDLSPEVLRQLSMNRESISDEGLPCESYRRVPVAEALRMLHRRAEPAAV